MPTDKIIETPLATTSIDVQDLVQQLGTILSDRGIALNSVIDGLLNGLHVTNENVIFSGGSPRLMPLSEGVGVITLNTGGAAYVLQGMAVPVYEGRIVHIINNNLLGPGTITCNHNDGAVTATERFSNAGAAAVVVPNLGHISFCWVKDTLIHTGGAWRQIA